MLAASGVLALAFAAPAAAGESISPDDGGADQYVAPVPDAGGNRPSGPGPGAPHRLPPGVRSSLPPGSEGSLLARIATDPGSGAPSGSAGNSASGGKGSSSGGNGGSGANGGAPGGTSESAGNAGGGNGAAHEADATAASAITHSVSDNPGVGVLLGGILILTLGAAGLGLIQRRDRGI